tara:strand:+ start:196 stop:753 length:558 start_codon:yes stop_codon:yes gene_type:complete
MIYENLSSKIIDTLEKTISQKIISSQVEIIAKLIKHINENGKIIVIFGNGGSAADSQHFAGELMCTYKNKKRKPLKALALTTDTSIITAWANDFSYESVFERQIEGFSNQIGLAIGLSTSGQSRNVINGLIKAEELGIKTCLISGELLEKKSKIDFSIEIPSKDTEIIQTITQVIYHAICQEIEK